MSILEERCHDTARAFLVFAASVLAGCSTMGSTQVPARQHAANPASERCIKLGGSLMIESRPNGGQFGTCVFEDNRQCEEWALFRGECGFGGVRITGYTTEAGRFCAITGGNYVVAASNASVERGSCTLPGGKSCDADAYYWGKCAR